MARKRVPEKKIDGAVTILGDNDEVVITIEDRDACVVIAKLMLTSAEFCLATMGRRSSVPCQVSIGPLEYVGKVMQVDRLEFPMGEEYEFVHGDERRRAAVTLAQMVTPEEYEADSYFGAQDSFFRRNGVLWARCTIRRWVDKSELVTDSK